MSHTRQTQDPCNTQESFIVDNNNRVFIIRSSLLSRNHFDTKSPYLRRPDLPHPSRLPSSIYLCLLTLSFIPDFPSGPGLVRLVIHSRDQDTIPNGTKLYLVLETPTSNSQSKTSSTQPKTGSRFLLLVTRPGTYDFFPQT